MTRRSLSNIVRGGLSLRVKLTAIFIMLVVGGASVSTLIGSWIITRAMLDQARTQVRHGLETARVIYGETLEEVEAVVERAAASEMLSGACSRTRLHHPEVVEALRAEAGLDFLSYIEVEAPDAPPATRAGDEISVLLVEASQGASVASTEIMDRSALQREDPAVARRAYLNITPVPKATPDTRTEVTAGMVLIAATPARCGGEGGVLYGGVLLTRSYDLVDRIKDLAFGRRRYHERDTGTASIFMSDVRIATNVMTGTGERAIGTRVSAEVERAVLVQGRKWYDRAFVVNDWYVTAYEPIRNHAGRIIGMLYVGMLEAPFLAVRTDVMLTFLVVAVLGVMIVMVLTYLITRSLISPLEEMVVATKTIAAGDLNHRVTVASHDEIGYLAVSFNRMVDSLHTMRQELQSWARTLEEKVQERTDELVNMQAQVVQSEKLASIGRLAAGVAHEINNPLGGILTLAMLNLEECGDDHPMRRDLDVIVKQTLRCREIVKGLLDFARQTEARLTRTDINGIMEATISLLNRQAIFQNIEIVQELQRDLPTVLIDPGHLQQVIINIVLNAVDAMEENGTLTLRTSHDPDKEEVTTRIGDTGAGIPGDVLPLIFEPFFTTKKVGMGTGLGLAVVHGIVTQAGGRIEIDTSERGTTVTVTLPVASAEVDSGADPVAGGGAG